jgi:hypothetical protein
MSPADVAMSRRTLSLLILSILLCCNGWAAVVQDVLQVRAGAFSDLRHAQASKAATCGHDHGGSAAQHHGSVDEPSIDDVAMSGVPDLRCAETVAPAFHRAALSATLPFRWLERPMRPPCTAALLA